MVLQRSTSAPASLPSRLGVRPACRRVARRASWLIALLCAAGAAHGQRFEIDPAAGPYVPGRALHVRLADLKPGSEVTVQAMRRIAGPFGPPRMYRAQARFKVPSDGRLDLAHAVPLPGSSYAAADVRGLFWSMTPLDGAQLQAWPAGEVHLHALEGAAAGAADNAAGARPLATATLQFALADPALQWREAAPFPGAKMAWLPQAAPGGGKRPAIIALGGSEGGSAILQMAGLLASHGFVVLGLPYYSPGGFGPSGPTPPEIPALPAAFADIPVERLEAAREWLAAQPEVDASRIGLYGASKGAEFALVAATRLPWVRSVAAIVPTDVVWEGWGPGVPPGRRSSFAWQGEPLPFVPYKDFEQELAGFQTGQPVRIRRPQDKGRAAFPDRVPAARIPVERFAGPLFVAGAHDDQVRDSGGMAEAIARTRTAAGRETETLVYREAGHALTGTGWAPTTQYNAGPMKMGGRPEADAAAQAEVFTRMLAFLQRTLAP